MAAPKARPSVSLVYDIDVEDPDSWCSVGLLTNTECHQKIITSKCEIKSFCDLSEDEQHSISLRVGTDDIDTVCLHHRKFYHFYEHHKRGCVDPLNSHRSKTTGDSVVVTAAMVEAAANVVQLEEGQRLCKVCVAGIVAKQDAGAVPPDGNTLAKVMATAENQDRCKTIEELICRCSVGLMTKTPCHLKDITSLVGLRSWAAVPSRLAYGVSLRLGRAFDNICIHHEKLYYEGHGPNCSDPNGMHKEEKTPSALWLVPQRFALACRGNTVLKPGQTICLKCLELIRERNPDVDAFFQADHAETQRKLDKTKDSLPAPDPQDLEDEEEVDDPSAKETVDSGAASKEEDAESSSAAEDVDSIGRRRRRRGAFSTTERQLRNLRVENPEFSEVLGQLDLKSKRREKRQVTKNVSNFVASQSTRSSRHYTVRGFHILSNRDACDCLAFDCPGCHFPCPKCRSTKCGDECRCSRTYVYEQLELDGRSGVIHNPLLG